ncbi:HNH endonuclease [Microbacter margulisiae]|uniref:HNH endonuclease 5 domain-containing protein n=1 Tax=Microbacter margulisiae TaxID=1350067 RepID=A0A7W5DN04_9PORP|nr:HNH endonuclease [Microbacter margulisiae]MBB3185920.1 hypothetical protein [Microbacter margulisiae]
MAKCYKCEVELTSDNESEEHIILNACGGRLKPKNLLCKTCNSGFGDSCDKILADSTNDLSNLLLIKRHRGEPQSIKGKLTSTGEDYYIQYGGDPMMSKPIISEVVDGEKVELSITARNEKEYKQILKGLKRKYPQLNIEEAIKTAEYKKEYLDDTIHFQSTIGGKEVFRSITKSAINYFIYKGGDRKYIVHLFDYLDEKEDLDIVWMHYPENTIYAPVESEVSHVIRVIGNPNEKILFAYIELFNVHNFIIKLNENYDGVPMDETYTFDLIEIKEIIRVIPLNYTRGQLLDLFENKDDKPFLKVQKRFERVVGLAMKRQSSNHNQELISRAINNSLGKYPEGTIITKEMIDELVKDTMKEITPMILHQLKRKNRDDDV